MPNIVLIGAGSASFSLHLNRDIVVSEGLAGSRLTLVDIDEQRLRVAHTLATRLCKEVDGRLDLAAVTDRRNGFSDADFVICAVKVGGSSFQSTRIWSFCFLPLLLLIIHWVLDRKSALSMTSHLGSAA